MDSNKNSSNVIIGKGKESIQSSDIISGLIVSLLALPLSLGIAKASDFPPLMGLISAIIGGLVVSFLTTFYLGENHEKTKMSQVTFSPYFSFTKQYVFPVQSYVYTSENKWNFIVFIYIVCQVNTIFVII